MRHKTSITTKQLLQKICLQSSYSQAQITPFTIPTQKPAYSQLSPFKYQKFDLINVFQNESRHPQKPKILKSSIHSQQSNKKPIVQKYQYQIADPPVVNRTKRNSQHSQSQANSFPIQQHIPTINKNLNNNMTKTERSTKFSNNISNMKYSQQILRNENITNDNMVTQSNQKMNNNNNKIKNQQLYKKITFQQIQSNKKQSKNKNLSLDSAVFNQAFICKYSNFDPRYCLKLIQHLHHVRQAQLQQIFNTLQQLKQTNTKYIPK